MDVCEDFRAEYGYNNKHGDAIAYEIEHAEIQQATQGAYVDLFSALSKKIHKAELLITDEHEVVVPSNLTSVETRFLIRFLIGSGWDKKKIVIVGSNGVFRKPNADEIETPGKKRDHQDLESVEKSIVKHIKFDINQTENNDSNFSALDDVK
jgi:hypothetical protein